MQMRAVARQLTKLVALPGKRRLKFYATCKANSDGTIRVVGSTSTPDRDGDIVEQDFDLDKFAQNPVILYGHNMAEDRPPIGRAKRFGVEGGKLVLDVEFVPKAVYPFAGLVADLYRLGFMKAFSIGYIPLETKTYKAGEQRPAGLAPWGQHVTRSELFELSAVAVPANAEALVSAGGKRISPIYQGAGRTVETLQIKGLDVDGVNRWFAAPQEEQSRAMLPAAAPIHARRAKSNWPLKPARKVVSMKVTKAAVLDECKAALDILTAEEGVTPESLAQAIDHIKAAMADPEESDAGEGADAAPPPKALRLLARRVKALEDERPKSKRKKKPPTKKARILAMLAKALKDDADDESENDDEDELDGALSGDIDLEGMDEFLESLGVDTDDLGEDDGDED